MRPSVDGTVAYLLLKGKWEWQAAFVWNPPGETLSAGPGDGPDRWAAVGQEQGNI